MRTLLVAAIVAVAMLVLPGVARAGTVHGDFNGDGYADLAIGVPGEDIGSAADAGAVEVLYGSANGITSAHNQFWHRNVAGVLGVAKPGAAFGSALESADYTGDGYADLAIAVGNEVQLLRGSATGLTAANDQIVVLAAPVGTFAAGDFTGDGRSDLAVGLPRADVGDVSRGGKVQILRGGSAGLAMLTGQLWSQNSAGILNASSFEDGFGSALAAGDFDHDGHADLAVGVPGESIHVDGREVELSGAVNVLRGTAGGLTATGNRFFILGSPGLPEAVGWGEQYFGTALAAGDFDGDGFVDLAASAPEENPEISIAGHGLVVTLYGSAVGLTGGRAQELRQPGGIIGDNFGWSLTAADLNGDGLVDLGIGSPLDEPTTKSLDTDWGSVVVMYAAAGTGITSTGAQIWGQYSTGVLESPSSREEFGTVIGSGDFRGDGAADLVIGTINETLVSSVGFEGAVNLLQGRPGTGISAAGDQLWSQNSSGVLDTAEFGDGFGASLAP